MLQKFSQINKLNDQRKRGSEDETIRKIKSKKNKTQKLTK